MNAALRLGWFALLCSAVAASSAPKVAPIVSQASTGEIEIHPGPNNDRIPDFSVCGYRGGSEAPPILKPRIVVAPVQGDATPRIQAAIDRLATQPAGPNGFRGAVLLLKGTHTLQGGLHITNSGIVLRGQGTGEDGTKIHAIGKDRRTVISFHGAGDLVAGSEWLISDARVPVGETSFKLAQPSNLETGMVVRVVRPSTAEWISSIGATDFGGGIGGGWKPGSRDITWDATVLQVSGGRIVIDVPITTAIEQETSPGKVISYTWPGRIHNVGVENLTIESRFDSGNPKDEDHAWCGVTFENVQDAWARQLEFTGFAGSAVAIFESCKRVTVQDCISTKPVSEVGGYRRHTFFTMGQQTLFLRCIAENGRHDFSVGHCAPGPNAFVQCEALSASGDSGPIESWASGVLYDNVNVDGNAIMLGFRPGNNAAVGWAAANCVLWNCSAAVIRCWTPPGAQNWSFGSWAGFEGDGVWRSSNDFMDPPSLFAAQLAKRVGSGRAGWLNLMPRPREESSNPTLERAQELAKMGWQPGPSLKAYIQNASKREPISTEPGDARSIDDIWKAVPPKSESVYGDTRLLITNGWLTFGGKLAIGGTAGVPWWRGNIRPSEAAAAMPAVTRFVPGRSGLGYTDNIDETAQWLMKNGKVALDHNYGLWYDRRRDDHERVRRMDGSVLPPFYEQPFARSGQGSAWDGLSKYDLTQYNPWYWARLKEFARACESHGLVLFHQHYFQHNILEAGAHWADFPWRTANNVNETAFPEPPPYAGDKRIFQAEPFYDVAHPLRRELHEKYILQCLSNFTNCPNVIHFTSAEFTGPLHFAQFWLDTIIKWRHAREQVLDPVIALSVTKDVQDAILSDSARNTAVDIIDFRYWWRTPKGEFAPPGGKNLAPRQFERQWRGGRPSDTDLAGMVAEYVQRFPNKPLICDFDSAGWAWLCAGGSLPRLPASTDAKLLREIPGMRPYAVEPEVQLTGSGGWRPNLGKDCWILAQPGKQFLIHLLPHAERNLDISVKAGNYVIYVVHPGTGSLERLGPLAAGGHQRLPKEQDKSLTVWLAKD